MSMMTVSASKSLVPGLCIKKNAKASLVLWTPHSILDPTVGWDTDIFTYFDDRLLRLEHSAMLGAESVQVFVEITQVLEAEPEAHTEEEWQVLLDIDRRLQVLEAWVAVLCAQR